jgi:hypothetical protein
MQPAGLDGGFESASYKLVFTLYILSPMQVLLGII